VIEIITTLAHAVCTNCSTAICQTVGEWSGERWHHVANGRPECPGAPVAEPIPASVTQAQP
jgi:hypothetical protein